MKKNLLLLFLLAINIFVMVAQSVSIGENDEFFTKSGGVPTYDKATNNISSIRFPVNNPIIIFGNSPGEKANTFLRQNSTLFPIRNGIDNYQIKENKTDNYGLEHAEMQQYYHGVPVFDGILKFHFNKNGDLSSLNGNFITINKLNQNPSISTADAEATAIKHVTSFKNNDPIVPNFAKKSELLVFQKGLAQGINGPKHLVYEVEVSNNRDVREFVFVDAHTKQIVEQFTGIHHALDRKLYNTSYNPAATTTNRIWQEGDPLPGSLDIWQRSEIETAGQIYYMMKNAFGYTSYNNLDAPMITVHNDPTINCPNANWNGTTANYCTGIASDDVVAHEWGHAYTEYTSGLIYAWQSGALNESYSDIWGETVDQLNTGYFDSGEATGPRTNSCADVSKRWKMGESTTDGALRDMYNPNCDGISPGKVLDPMYWCQTDDSGGVHINSGIQNHAYGLLVDGGTYNGQTITGIGMLKAAHIFWYAQANLMTKTTDFAAQADNLENALNALIGINLPNLSTAAGASTLSGITINGSDLDELQKVLLAVEMRADNLCGFVAMLQPLAPICTGASDNNAIYKEDFEDGLAGWSVANAAGAGSNWTAHDWVSLGNAPENRPGLVAFGVNNSLGNCTSNQQNGVIRLTSPTISIPGAAIAPINMAFDHYMSSEISWDGGNLQFSINGGAFAIVPLSAFTNNGYNGTLNTPGQGNNNPLASQPAFTGADGGSVSGSWGQSRINLTALGLDPGENIQLRWNLGQDGCSGWDGWYIDDVRVYSCVTPTVQFVNNNLTVNEAEAITANVAPNECLPYVEKLIKIKINKAPTQPATITFNTPTGTASIGTSADISFSPNSVILQAGSLEQDVLVRIYNDDYVELNETFTLNYTLNAGSGDAIPELFNQSFTITITDDDLEPGSISTTVLYENFENNDFSLPVGWTAYLGNGTTPDPTSGTFSASWSVAGQAGKLAPDGSKFLIADSDEFGPGLWDKIIETKPFNTLGASAINFSMVEHLLMYLGPNDVFNEIGTMEVWDGSAWHNILTHAEANGDVGTFASPLTTSLSIPLAYSNAAMKLRFRFQADWDYWWMLDNIKVDAVLPTQVQSIVNTTNPAEAYLGPMETAVFYDPTSGNLLAKIKNLTNHDYGCTTVEIYREGNGMVPWFGPYQISAKGFKVTPTNNNPIGEYEINFYYTNVEKTGITINSMGKTSVNSMGNNVSYASVQEGSIFNSDYSYKAIFDSGFSSFGLSNAMPVVGPLPVKLISFEGKNIETGNQLTWKTSAETNNEAFVIERSENAQDYVSIGQLRGIGTSKEINKYVYLDANFATGINYYRLKQLDKDGKYSFSNTIAIEASQSFRIVHSPNPVISKLNISTPFIDSESIDFKLINSAGIEIQNSKLKAKAGKIESDLTLIPTGIYYIILKAKSETYHLKIVKQ